MSDVEKKLKKSAFVFSVFLVMVFIIGLINCRFAEGNSQKTAADVNDGNTVHNIDKPLIIWFHNGGHNKPDTLEKALSSGIVTHVLILYSNTQDTPLKKQENAWGAVNICKKYKIPIIWCRCLWPSYGRNFPRSGLFEQAYYENTIEQIRREAKILGAEFTAIDTEPYGYFPFKAELRKGFNKKDFDKMKQAVDGAIRKKGQLDFALPAAYAEPTHPYNALIQLAKIKIAEHTYYNIPALHNDKRRPYDVFGAYVSITTKNETYPDRPFFTLKEILERQDLWGHKKGLMLYPREDEIPQVVEAMNKITYIEPNKPSK